MARKCQIKGTLVLRRRGDTRLVLCFSLLLALLLALASGCQKSASAGKVPQTQPSKEQATVQVKDSQAKAEPQPAEKTEPVAASEAAPKITLKEAVHDFGDIGPDTTHTAQFTFTNSGKAPLKIIQVKSCCGVVARSPLN